ncbi:MAG: hypothetical protein JRL30_24690 [Deltaproteobacteria bacterium]|nr:hypothetical protein [Deltaproteobacteria bacterium]
MPFQISCPHCQRNFFVTLSRIGIEHGVCQRSYFMYTCPALNIEAS